MKTFHLAALAALVIGGLSVPAFAATYSGSCTSEPQSKWLPTAKVKQQYQQQGYSVRGVKSSGTCYEVSAVDNTGKKVELLVAATAGYVIPAEFVDNTGKNMELFVNPATGALVQQAGEPAAKP